MSLAKRLAGFKWVASGVLPLMVVLMDTCWVYPWLVWVGNLSLFREPRPPLSLLTVFLLLSVSLFLSRTLLSRSWRLGWIRLGIVAAGLVAVFVGIRLEYGAGSPLLSAGWFTHTARILLDSFARPHTLAVALFAGVLLWWRGISCGRSLLDFRDIYRAFVAGLIALVLLIIIRRIIATEGSPSAMGLYVAGFFLFGLASLALSNLRAIQQKIQARGEAAALLSRRWVYLLFGVVGSIVLVGVAITSLLSREFVALIERFLGLALNVLLQALGYLVMPLGYIVEGLFRAFQFIVNLFRSGTAQPLESVNMSPISGLPEGVTPRALSPEVLVALKWSVFALLVGAVVFLLVRAVFRYRARGDQTDVDEFDESLWSWAGFRADLRLFFGAVRQNLKRRTRGPLAAKPATARYGVFPDMMSIREVYRHLLREAAGVGMERARQETPNEYARRLSQMLTEGNEELDELTALYVGVRYGDIPVKEEQVSQANRLWRFLYGILDRLRDAGQVA